MDKKRKINDSGSGTIAKKKKNMKGDENPIQSTETPRNTLTAMPDHILEKILSYLDLEDRKSFSECCKTLNNIFNCRSNMKNVWLKVEENQKVSEISRPYANMFWPCVGWATRGVPGMFGVQQTIPKRLWKRLIPSLTAFRIESSTWDYDAYVKCALNAKKLIDCLPFFVNLTHLDLVFETDFVFHRLMKNKPPDVHNPTKMEKLKVLKISYELFFFFDGRYIDFDIKNIHTLIISRCHDIHNRKIFASEDFNKIRSLISNQCNLQKLHLLGGYIHEIFDFPLIFQSQLEEFKFATYKQVENEFNTAQQDNLYYSFQSQRQLQLMECNLGRQVNKSDKMKRFARSIPNRPLKSQRLAITETSSGSDWCEKYSMQEMIEISIEPANLSTKKLQLVINGSISETNQSRIIPMIVTKFPNLTSLCIAGLGILPADQENILDTLNNLHSLEIFELTGLCQHLRAISIPHLKQFVFNYHCGTTDSADMIDFIERHQSLEELHFKAISGVNPTSLSVVENVLHLKKLSRFTFECSPAWGRLDISSQKRLIISWIEKHAKPGLVFSVPPIYLMKSYDNEIVEKVEGKWKSIAPANAQI